MHYPIVLRWRWLHLSIADSDSAFERRFTPPAERSREGIHRVSAGFVWLGQLFQRVHTSLRVGQSFWQVDVQSLVQTREVALGVGIGRQLPPPSTFISVELRVCS
jgi:hypothetical protein